MHQLLFAWMNAASEQWKLLFLPLGIENHRAAPYTTGQELFEASLVPDEVGKIFSGSFIPWTLLTYF